MILGQFAGGPAVRTDYNQTDPSKADYLVGRESIAKHLANDKNPHGVTAAQAGARPDSWTPTAMEVGARPNTWIPTAVEVGARPNTWLPTIAEIGAAPAKKTIVKTLTTAGWHRVGLISIGSCCIHIRTEFGNNQDMSALVYGSVTGYSASLSKASVAFRSGTYKTIDQVRLVENGDACYVDIHYVPNAGNRVFIFMDGIEGWQTTYQEWTALGEGAVAARATLAL